MAARDLWPVAFYLVGSIPTGFLIARCRGIDIRKEGSGNIGATNVWRVMGRGWGILAFAFDFLKGFLPLFLLRQLAFPGALDWETSLLLVICGLAAIVGHNYTPWLGFKGGKGVATTAGVMAALLPWALLASFTLWLILVLLTRIVSIGSLAAAVLLPLATAFFYPGQYVFLGLAAFAAGLVIWAHRANMQRLRAGTEARFGSSAKKTP